MENTVVKKWEVADIELTYKSKIKPSLRPKISSSKDAHEVLRQSWNQDKIELVEQFKVLLTNRGNRVLGIIELSTGGIVGCVVDPKLIFAAALKGAATGLIISHNHPSGNLTPSQADVDLTKRFGKLHDFSKSNYLITSLLQANIICHSKMREYFEVHFGDC